MIDTGTYVLHDDLVEVHFRDRSPDRVQWNDVTYIVGGAPQEWIYHEPWWHGDGGTIDVIAWRLVLHPLPGQRIARRREVDIKPAGTTWRIIGERVTG